MKYYYLNPILCQFKVTPKYVSVYAQKNGHPIMVAKINKTAYEILLLCNGSNTKEMICEEMKLKYSNFDDIDEFVTEYLNENIKIKLVLTTNEKTEVPNISIIGSESTWIPEYIAIDMTNNCPLRCKHCYLNAGKGNIKYMETQMLHDICNEVLNLKIPMVQLTGGEPLLHKDIYKTMDHLQKNNVAIQLFTSGYLNNEETVNKLLKYKNDNFFIQVSIDGMQEYHNKFRGKEDAFQKSMDFIKKMTQNGIHVMVATCISEQKEEEVYKLAKLLKENGVKLLRIGYVSNRGRANDNNISGNEQIIKYVKSLKNNLSELLDSDLFKVELVEDFDKLAVCGNCGLGQMTLKIDAFGDIYPCIMSDFKIGNYMKENIEVTQNRCAQLFADMKAPCRSICGECEKETICSHCIIEAMMYCDSTKNWYRLNYPLLNKIKSGHNVK